MATPNTGIPYVPENTTDPAVGLNLALNVIDALLQTAVLDMDRTEPPESPSDGDLHIVAAGATGAWEDQDDNLARYVAQGDFWQFYAAGTRVKLVLNFADGGLYKYVGAWVLAAGLSDAPSDGSTYGRKDGAWAVTGGGGGSGTVTSVDLDVPAGFTVSGAPVTTSGTITINYDTGYQGYTATEATKLSGIAAGATVGATWGTNLSSIPAIVSALAGLSNASGVLTNNGSGTLSWGAGGGGSGDVVGPASSTDEAVALFDGTTGKLLKDGQTIAQIKRIEQNSQSAAYTLVLSDAGKHILHPSADTTARTFTIPANSSVAFPIGTAVTFVNQNSAGTVTIAITTDTMRLAGAGTTGSRTLAANGVATALKITSTEWIISGTGLT
jgi:hypothetical protein